MLKAYPYRKTLSDTYRRFWTLDETELTKDLNCGEFNLQERQAHTYALSGTVAKGQFQHKGIQALPVVSKESTVTQSNINLVHTFVSWFVCKFSLPFCTSTHHSYPAHPCPSFFYPSSIKYNYTPPPQLPPSSLPTPVHPLSPHPCYANPFSKPTIPSSPVYQVPFPISPFFSVHPPPPHPPFRICKKKKKKKKCHTATYKKHIPSLLNTNPRQSTPSLFCIHPPAYTPPPPPILFPYPPFLWTFQQHKKFNGWPDVNILWLSLICKFCLSVTTWNIVWADPYLRWSYHTRKFILFILL